MKHVAIPILSGAVMLGAILACTSNPDVPPVPGAGSEPASVLPFVENDYALALSRAREAKLPLFVEVWAPW